MSSKITLKILVSIQFKKQRFNPDIQLLFSLIATGFARKNNHCLKFIIKQNGYSVSENIIQVQGFN